MCRQARPGGERGFTVLEVLVATALIAAVALTGLAACKTIAHVTLSAHTASNGAESIDEQIGQLHNDAATAFAVFVPAADRFGRPNDGQELDFYSQADDGRAIRWCYFYDAAAQTLQRWDYDGAGPYGVRSVDTGAVDPGAAYPPLRHIVRFAAAALGADQLGDPHRNTYYGIAALFARRLQAWPVRYGDPRPGAASAVGGNGLVQVSIENATAARVAHLAAGSMPTGFTVTGALLWHAVVYRDDQTHRFFLGPASKSHVFINARVDVSYDGWKTRIRWCQFNLLGNPGGLDPHDPHADYKPGEAVEGAASIFAACRERRPFPPAPNSPGYPPDPDAAGPQLPAKMPPCGLRPGPGACPTDR
jgi:prepilin-type N-terminal cleavage/methylation domain-containing protein